MKSIIKLVADFFQQLEKRFKGVITINKMSSLNFQCDICQHDFTSLRGLNMHKTKMHNVLHEHKCNYCQKILATKYNLNVHENTCKVKKESQTTEEPKTINNYITNNNYINNNNNTNNYVGNTSNHNNNFINNKFDALVPISENFLIDKLQHLLKDVIKNKQYIKDAEDMGVRLSTGPLSKSLICTDASRGTIHWKDGDQNNIHVKDPQCKQLSAKMHNALNKQQDILNEYKDYLCSEFSNVFIADDYGTDVDINSDFLYSITEAQDLFRNLKNNEETFMRSLGKQVAKNVNPSIVDNTKSLNTVKLKELIVDHFTFKPYEFLLFKPKMLGVILTKVLFHLSFEILDENTIQFKDNEIIIKATKDEICKELQNILKDFEPSFDILFAHFTHPKNISKIEMFTGNEELETLKNNVNALKLWVSNDPSVVDTINNEIFSIIQKNIRIK